MPPRGDLVIRSYEERDEDAVLRLLARSLGKDPDGRYRAFFRWKHVENPVGRSLAWVAEIDGQLVGYRTFLRWRFRGPDGPVDAVRAVDTATDPAHRGAGVFRRLTEHGLAQLESTGVRFVFNTPNDQSRPGYLKMGWVTLGRAPIQMRPRSVVSLARLLTARTAASLWSEPTEVGTPAAAAFGSPDLDDAVAAFPGTARAGSLTTERTAAFLRWRYAGFDPVASRVLRLGHSLADGFILFRLRRRGGALECSVGDVLVPDPARGAALVRHALQETGADYALATAPPAARFAGFLAIDRLGPTVAWRAVAREQARPDLAFALGDLELF